MSYEAYQSYRDNYLNGNKMNLQLFINGMPIVLKQTTFPAGETCLTIKDNNYVSKQEAVIVLNFKNNSDLFDLALLADAVRRFHGNIPIDLIMPYLPYARQDRVCNEGESLSVKVVADFINNLNFRRVGCEDIHSEVGKALINNLEHKSQAECAWQLPNYCRPESTVLVSPDAGAEKKVFDFAKKLGYDSVIRASKVRNVATGKIERTTLIDELPYNVKINDGLEDIKDLMIVDDICDGGRTFVELAKELNKEFHGGYRKVGYKISLYVTHGIFSAGMEVFDGLIDKVYTHNLMNESVRNHPSLVIV